MNETLFTFGIECTCQDFLPFRKIISCKETRNKKETWRIKGMDEVGGGYDEAPLWDAMEGSIRLIPL